MVTQGPLSPSLGLGSLRNTQPPSQTVGSSYRIVRFCATSKFFSPKRNRPHVSLTIHSSPDLAFLWPVVQPAEAATSSFGFGPVHSKLTVTYATSINRQHRPRDPARIASHEEPHCCGAVPRVALGLEKGSLASGLSTFIRHSF